MIVCSCTGITSRQIRDAVDWMRAADPNAFITPGKIYRSLGRRPVCGGCLPLFVQQLHASQGGPLPAELRNLRGAKPGGREHEGRRQGHRVPEQGAPQRADGGEPVLAALPAAE